jgi:hypothetical protein
MLQKCGPHTEHPPSPRLPSSLKARTWRDGETGNCAKKSHGVRATPCDDDGFSAFAQLESAYRVKGFTSRGLIVLSQLAVATTHGRSWSNRHTVASSFWRLTGLVRWASKPAFWARSTSSCMPKPVSAMAGVFLVSRTFLIKSMPVPSRIYLRSVNKS